MSEIGKVRIVRCPKCDNLLPEVTEYSVYQCGGCGAVLRAKNKGVDLETFSEKSDEERVGASLEKLSDRYEKMSVSEINMTDLIDGSESDVRSSISTLSRAEMRVLRVRGENYSPSLMNRVRKSDVEANEIQGKEFQQMKISHDFDDPRIWNENDSLQNSGRFVDGKNGENSVMDAEVMRYLKEGPSNPLPMPSYDYGIDGFEHADYVGEERLELLKKLDELKDKLSRSGNLVRDGKETAGTNRRTAYQDPYPSEYRYLDAQFKRPPYKNQYPEPHSLIDHEGMGRYGYYPPRYTPNHVRGYEDPSRPHMLVQGPQQAPPYQQPPPREYNYGPYGDDGSVYMDTIGHHHPACSCYHCRNKPSSYSDKYSDISNDRMYGGSFGSQDYNNSRFPDPRLRSGNHQLHTRWPSDVTSEVNGFVRRRPPRVHLASSGRHFRPLAGGAPFFTCSNCFELLRLPKKILTNNQKKMKCSACSMVIVCSVFDKNVVFSIDVVEANDTVVKVDDGYQNPGKTTFSSDDYDNSGYDFRSMDQEPVNKMKNGNSMSNYNSDMEEKGDNKHLVNRFGEGNISGRSENEKEVPRKITARQISRKESSATEIDLSSNEYGNTGSTFESGERSREGEQLKGGRRVADSFFAGFIKKSFKDSNKSDQTAELVKANVTVNGHLIQDRLIKKAEKLAGPIHPGNYWYDFRAGFWGAVGGPCLGIIPPFIEEFNYPMPEQCGGGNTHVFVNGRELNQKDLNLLGSRGLPRESNRSYIIEISGRILDEDTGEELEGLGKLAPTVEKAKRGFGMRDPTAVAQ